MSKTLTMKWLASFVSGSSLTLNDCHNPPTRTDPTRNLAVAMSVRLLMRRRGEANRHAEGARRRVIREGSKWFGEHSVLLVTVEQVVPPKRNPPAIVGG